MLFQGLVPATQASATATATAIAIAAAAIASAIAIAVATATASAIAFAVAAAIAIATASAIATAFAKAIAVAAAVATVFYSRQVALSDTSHVASSSEQVLTLVFCRLMGQAPVTTAEPHHDNRDWDKPLCRQ